MNYSLTYRIAIWILVAYGLLCLVRLVHKDFFLLLSP
jgi:hypothetical protein